jgi:hypothetical protein
MRNLIKGIILVVFMTLMVFDAMPKNDKPKKTEVVELTFEDWSNNHE